MAHKYTGEAARDDIASKKQMEKIPPHVSRTCSLQYDGNADCFPRIVEHILQSKRIPPKYLGFSPRFMVNKFYIINRKSNFLRMEIFLRLFHFCSHFRRRGGGGGGFPEQLQV